MTHSPFKKLLILFAVAALFALPAATAAPLAPVDDDGEADRFVVIKAGHIITVTGEEIENGMIVVRNGVIEAVGKKVEIPFPAKIIDAKDLWIMPGLVNPYTNLGMRRYFRSGVKSHMKVSDELDLDEEILKEILECGFTTLGYYPQGRGVPGQGAAVRPLDAGHPDRLLDATTYILMLHESASSDKRLLKGAFARAKKEIEKQEKARKEWEAKQKKAAEEAKKKAEAEKKKAEEKKKEGSGKDKPAPAPDKTKKPAEGEKKKEPAKFVPPPIDPAHLPIADLIRRANTFVHFQDGMKDFEFARSFLLRNEPNTYYGCDLGIVADKVAEEKPLVILNPNVNYRPFTRNRFNLAQVLDAAGCKIAFRTRSDSVSAYADQLRRVAEMVRGGLKRETALKAVTLHPAEILGVADRVGSLEKDRDADLLFLTGDPFDPLTRVDRVMIRGEIVASKIEIQ